MSIQPSQSPKVKRLSFLAKDGDHITHWMKMSLTRQKKETPNAETLLGIECEICQLNNASKRVYTWDELVNHMTKNHKSTPQPSKCYGCPYCLRNFKNKKSICQHLSYKPDMIHQSKKFCKKLFYFKPKLFCYDYILQNTQILYLPLENTKNTHSQGITHSKSKTTTQKSTTQCIAIIN